MSKELNFGLYNTRKKMFVSSIWYNENGIHIEYGNSEQAAQFHYQCAFMVYETLPEQYKNILSIVKNKAQQTDGYAANCWKCQHEKDK